MDYSNPSFNTSRDLGQASGNLSELRQAGWDDVFGFQPPLESFLDSFRHSTVPSTKAQDGRDKRTSKIEYSLESLRPLFLPANLPPGPSDFQSNRASVTSSHVRVSNQTSHSFNGLGIQLEATLKSFADLKATSIKVEDGTDLPLRQPSHHGLDFTLPHYSSPFLSMLDPFDDSENHSLILDDLAQNRLLDPKGRYFPTFSNSKDMRSSTLGSSSSSSSLEGISDSSSTDSSYFRGSHDNLYTKVGLQTPPIFNSPPAIAGPLVDINMFDKQTGDGGIFVRPQDLVGDGGSGRQYGSVEERCEQPVKAEERREFQTCELFPSNGTLGLASHTPTTAPPPQPPSSALSDEQLSHVVDYFFLNVRPSAGPAFVMHGESKATDNVLNHSFTSDNGKEQTSDLANFSSSARNFMASDGRARSAKGRKTRLKLGDVTNSPKASRSGLNILDNHEAVPMCDLVLNNAYLGISEQDVAQKTLFFKLIHPGQKLSDELLFNFAGRLSETGEQILGYRCYIEQCNKTTKRKDHMADHVRTHLGEKPFHCGICGLGFIRNNDCQRHENNHRPDKKFICECQAAFSRRDLFVRHQKTACSLSSKKSIGSRRPRRKAERITGWSSESSSKTDIDFMGNAFSIKRE